MAIEVDRVDGPASGAGTTRVCQVYLQGLVQHWHDGFDWRAQEARLNAFAPFIVTPHGIDLYVLHVQGKGP